MRSSHDSQYSKGAASAWMQPLPFLTCFLYLKNGLSHTGTLGVTQTTYAGVTHTDFEAQ